METPRMASAPVRVVAATLPGFAGTTPPEDLEMETYARAASTLANEVGADVALGHSMGGNIAIEMAASGGFEGPLVLLAPSFSRTDESKLPRALNQVGKVLGDLPFKAMLKLVGPAMKKALPPHRHAALVAEFRKNDPGFLRRTLPPYLAYLDRHGSVAPPLCAAAVPSWVVFGEKDDVGVTAEERRTLDACE